MPAAIPIMHDIPPPGEVIYAVRQPANSPPGGWRYKQAETQREWFNFGQLEELAMEVANHRQNNGLPPGSPEGDVMHYTGGCLVAEGHAELVETQGPVGRTLGQWSSGARAYAKVHDFMLRSRRLFVEQETADARAAICVRCPKNVTATNKGLLRKMADRAMQGAVQGRTTPHDAKLGTCAVCSCPTAFKLHFTAEFLQEVGVLKKISAYPPNCLAPPMSEQPDSIRVRSMQIVQQLQNAVLSALDIAADIQNGELIAYDLDDGRAERLKVICEAYAAAAVAASTLQPPPKAAPQVFMPPLPPGVESLEQIASPPPGQGRHDGP